MCEVFCKVWEGSGIEEEIKIDLGEEDGMDYIRIVIFDD